MKYVDMTPAAQAEHDAAQGAASLQDATLKAAERRAGIQSERDAIVDSRINPREAARTHALVTALIVGGEPLTVQQQADIAKYKLRVEWAVEMQTAVDACLVELDTNPEAAPVWPPFPA